MFIGTAEANANDTERFWLDGDIKNATIKIHAMKSSSRIIGATDLGELAQELENAGHENDCICRHQNRSCTDSEPHHAAL